MNMKSKLLLVCTLVTLIIFNFNSSVVALTIDIGEVGELDSLYSVTGLLSGAAEEANWINGLLGTSYTTDYIENNKQEVGLTFYSVTGGLANQWAFELPAEDGYFLLKTGNGAGSYATWLFQNNPSSLYGTFVFGYVYDLSVPLANGDETVVFDITNIEAISHITKAGPVPAPEPSTLLLLGAGLVGLGGWARRFKK